jgi:glycyl-tRNA synthetase
MNTLVSLAKRRGFVFPASEIYGGIGSTWDYGPLGVELKRNVKDAWWRAMVRDRDDIVGLDSAIIQSPRVWEASGHVAGFTDPLVECRNCHHRFRADHLESDKCPDCGAVGKFTEARQFNLMFKTFLGPVEEEAAIAYLRPETAQGIFTNFQNVQTVTRKKLPFGIAQIGKSFRNEITPGNFIFRTREFEQMEMEYFVRPDDGFKALDLWKEERMRWYTGLGIAPERLRFRQHEKDELAHYAKAVFDIEYLFPIGWSELEGIAYRGDFDLRQHQEHSGKKLEYFDEERQERFIPHVVEPASGVDRSLLAFLTDAYHEEEVRGETRTVLKLHKDLAPYKVAVLPLSRNEKLAPTARKVHNLLRVRWMTDYDDAQSIGRRYRRQDEIGTPYCVTVDFETVETDNAVTIRDRDTMDQVRVPISNLPDVLKERLG